MSRHLSPFRPPTAARALYRRRFYARLLRRNARRPAGGHAATRPSARLHHLPTGPAAHAPEPEADAVYTFGFARPADARSLAALLRSGPVAPAGRAAGPDGASGGGSAAPTWRARLAAVDADPDADVLVARRGSAVVGAALVVAHPGSEGHLPAGVHVAAAERGRGVGRRLGHLALAWLAVEGVATARVPECVSSSGERKGR